ncbi:hypothetical protein DL93DRAFT_2072797 [Clavulina sp. PMI_390]|nr:hypothetical protein DL93DRAFT_2072797 [Clavulina sp. PMI_390]
MALSLFGLVFDVAPFASNQLPSEDQEPPVWWALFLIFVIVFREQPGTEQTSAAGWREVEQLYQNRGVELISTFVESRSLFAHIPGAIGKGLMEQRDLMGLFLDFILANMGKLPKTSRVPVWQATIRLGLRIRVACTVEMDPLLTPRESFFTRNTNQLKFCLIVIRKLTNFRRISLEEVAARTYKEIIGQAFRLIRHPQVFHTDLDNEYELLALMVLADRSPNLIPALRTHEYVKISGHHAVNNISSLPAPTGSKFATTDAAAQFMCLVGTWSWCILETLKAGDFCFALDFIECGLVFGCEKFSLSISIPDLSIYSVKITNTITTMQRSLLDSGTEMHLDSLTKLVEQINIITSRLRTKPSTIIPDEVKQLWTLTNFAGTSQELVEAWNEEFVCGLVGCSSTRPAKLQCARCKVQYYCSVECQKPDWKSHKKVCNVIG